MSFWRFVLVRLAWAAFGLLLAVTIVFVITRVLVSPIEICREAGGERPDAFARCYRAYTEQLDLNEPIHERYLHFLSGLVADPSGARSLATGRDTGPIVRHALPPTAAIVGAAMVFALLLAAAAGIAWSRVARKWDRVIRLPIYLTVGLSPVFLGWLLARAVGYEWPVPNFGGCSPSIASEGAGCGETREWLSHLVLPAVTLGLFFAGVYTRMVRTGIGDIRAISGTKERRELKRRFVLVLARVAGRDFGWAVGVAVLVESLFVIPGLGRTAVGSVSNADPFLLETVLLYAVLLAIAVHFMVDVVVAALDADLRAEWPVAGMPRPA